MTKWFPTTEAFREALKSTGFITRISMLAGLWAGLLVASTQHMLSFQSVLLVALPVTAIWLTSASVRVLQVARSWDAWQEYTRIMTRIGRERSTDFGGEESSSNAM